MKSLSLFGALVLLLLAPSAHAQSLGRDGLLPRLFHRG